MSEPNDIELELDRPLRLTDIGDEALSIEVTTSDTERAAVCKRLGILDVLMLESNLSLRWVDANSLVLSNDDAEIKGELLRVEGRLRSTVCQACVLTLEPVVAEIEQTFLRHYGEGDPRHRADDAIDLEIFRGEGSFAQIEIVDRGRINLGEIVIEELALSLDPYPRAIGVTLEDELAEGGHQDVGTSEAASNPKESPFSVLEKLKARLAGDGER